MIVVTTNEIPGYRIQAVLGEVMGLTVRSTNIGGAFTASLRAIGGGEIPEYTTIMYESRHEVMRRMVDEARERGANAVVAMRFDTGAVGNFSEVCVYGTAVVAEPIPAGEAGATGQSAQVAAATPAAEG
ncbi:YbjQ family protein [Cellulomonas fimi]|uniref:UPF0145 protein Celf_1447 n=1 Tax=Cellulomonas fimi (strain ATCC 484 / DSM 20113 / JCM 1341 / CCUG 24087 / LMG 16345 / NBRC 15513 / NCIMB 8980 / NCTC 7547 / NRS-133) TaxID=590998 RepID=F4H6E9_CELFA|nr:YbjQ family protein [Cellulomonas fimi]AEE45582.1 protein of unknown function DUF74 [Cellulomonas fimi ATCC 484]NNH05908.1 YbjQ family protein [Cellulomonas fimi]VEH29946.1 Domain of uncharacterised function (DUF74) [Cellulomonas fimi]